MAQVNDTITIRERGAIFGLKPSGHPASCWHVQELRLCKHFCNKPYLDRCCHCEDLAVGRWCEICQEGRPK